MNARETLSDLAGSDRLVGCKVRLLENVGSFASACYELGERKQLIESAFTKLELVSGEP